MPLLLTIQPQQDEKREFFHQIDEEEILLDEKFLNSLLEKRKEKYSGGSLKLIFAEGRIYIQAKSGTLTPDSTKSPLAGNEKIHIANGRGFTVGDLHIICSTLHPRVGIAKSTPLKTQATQGLLVFALLMQIFLVFWLPSYMSRNSGFERGILMEQVASQLDETHKQISKGDFDEIHNSFIQDLRSELKKLRREFRLFPKTFSVKQLQQTMEKLEEVQLLHQKIQQSSMTDHSQLPEDLAEEILGRALRN